MIKLTPKKFGAFEIDAGIDLFQSLIIRDDKGEPILNLVLNIDTGEFSVNLFETAHSEKPKLTTSGSTSYTITKKINVIDMYEDTIGSEDGSMSLFAKRQVFASQYLTLVETQLGRRTRIFLTKIIRFIKYNHSKDLKLFYDALIEDLFKNESKNNMKKYEFNSDNCLIMLDKMKEFGILNYYILYEDKLKTKPIICFEIIGWELIRDSQAMMV